MTLTNPRGPELPVSGALSGFVLVGLFPTERTEENLTTFYKKKIGNLQEMSRTISC